MMKFNHQPKERASSDMIVGGGADESDDISDTLIGAEKEWLCTYNETSNLYIRC